MSEFIIEGGSKLERQFVANLLAKGVSEKTLRVSVAKFKEALSTLPEAQKMLDNEDYAAAKKFLKKSFFEISRRYQYLDNEVESVFLLARKIKELQQSNLRQPNLQRSHNYQTIMEAYEDAVANESLREEAFLFSNFRKLKASKTLIDYMKNIGVPLDKKILVWYTITSIQHSDYLEKAKRVNWDYIINHQGSRQICRVCGGKVPEHINMQEDFEDWMEDINEEVEEE